MDLALKDKTALVMAGTRGLGLACASRLAAEGARVMICGRDQGDGQRACDRLGPDAQFVATDLFDPDQRADLFDAAMNRLGRVDILVTNGPGPRAEAFLDSAAAHWEQAFQQLVQPALDLVRRAVPGMASNGHGRVVSLGSISGKEISLLGARVNALRPALVGALGTLAREVATTGVTANTILCGPFDTDGLREVVREHSGRSDLSIEEAVQAYAETGPMKRIGDPNEVGALCAFLCSRQAGYITGQSIVIDGGRVATLY